MALIRCIECSKEISDTANSCPHCGSILNTKPTRAYETPERYTCRYCLKRFSKPAAQQEGFLFIGYCFSVCMKCFNLPQEKKKSKIEWLYLVYIIVILCIFIYSQSYLNK